MGDDDVCASEVGVLDRRERDVHRPHHRFFRQRQEQPDGCARHQRPPRRHFGNDQYVDHDAANFKGVKSGLE